MFDFQIKILDRPLGAADYEILDSLMVEVEDRVMKVESRALARLLAAMSDSLHTAVTEHFVAQKIKANIYDS